MRTPPFQNKVAIITGSSRGIGKATAIELAKKGAHVVINGRDCNRLSNAEQEIKILSQHVLAVCADVSKPDQAKLLIDKTIERFGRLDILINNAALSMRGYFSNIQPEVFQKILEINVLGVVNTTVPALPYIRDTKGSVVFISSLAAIRGMPNQSAYCSSKMALRAIAESIRVEEAGSGIHIGLIRVGVTEIEPEKQVLVANGSMLDLNYKTNVKVQSIHTVAQAILRNIRKRRNRATLTGIGKLLSLLQPVIPDTLEKILVRSASKYIRSIKIKESHTNSPGISE